MVWNKGRPATANQEGAEGINRPIRRFDRLGKPSRAVEGGLRRRAGRRKTGELEVAHAGKRAKRKDRSRQNQLVVVKNRVESDRNAKSGSLQRLHGEDEEASEASFLTRVQP